MSDEMRSTSVKSTLTWPLRLLWLVLWFLGQLCASSVKVVRDSFRPHASIQPGFIVFRTRCRTEFEVSLLSVLITLTPGTLTLGATRRGPTWDIVVHGMYFPEPEELTDSIHDMEEHMLAAIRRTGSGR